MGIPCLTADTESLSALQKMVAEDPTAEVTVDLDAMAVRAGDFAVPVAMGDGARQMFLSGTWDACGQLVAQAEAIAQTAGRLPYIAWAVG